MSKRNTYTYHQKVGNKIVHSGITNDLDRRESEHQQRWSNSHIMQVGRIKSKESAREWEKDQPKHITPDRRK
jgi:predicted GIY-YIG superfamily endonuclease